MSFLKTKIDQRIQSNSLRTLKSGSSLIDFSSNDYLGFARSNAIKAAIEIQLNNNPSYSLGSTGSRLLSGNSKFCEELEQYIAKFHHANSGLLFNSGYDANIGLLSSVAQRGDTIITDKLIHASLIDGARLSYANRYVFKHNDLNSLEEKLRNSKGNIFIVTESIFSMDGDFAPLKEIAKIAKKYKANLIVDEAHATGILGEYGAGLVSSLNLESEVFARIHTFGKAIGCHGAIILGSEELRTYLINFARSFIYTTALPYHTMICIKVAYENLIKTETIDKLRKNIAYFIENSKNLNHIMIPSESAIQCLLIPGNERCKFLSNHLQIKGFEVRPILSPTVSEGGERLRICLHAYNTKEEIQSLIFEISKMI